jgi:hypothetical protein
MVSAAAGTARAVIPNLCQFTSFPPHAGFVRVRVPRGAGERHLVLHVRDGVPPEGAQAAGR